MEFQRGLWARPAAWCGRAGLMGCAWLIAISSVVGCTGGEVDTGRALLLTQTAANRTIWEDAAISNYEFVYQRACFCGADVLRALRIQVRNGVVTSVTFADTGEALTNTAIGPFPTLDALFDDLQTQIIQADNVNAEFDTRYGFPAHYVVDSEVTVADEEYAITVTEFREL